MITGSVNDDLEARFALEVTGTHSRPQRVEAVIDTGFTGYLTLPLPTIQKLQLTWLGREQGVLADGAVERFDVYRATVTWNGQPRPVVVQAVSASPLVGMGLLEGHRLQIEVMRSGKVSISPLP